MKRHDARLALVAIGLLIGHPSLFAQTAEITGQVVDPSGASVPEASVTVANLATGIKSSRTTNEAGYYTVPFLDPGDYAITVTKTGFKTVTRSGIKLDVAQIARLDFSLDVGVASETVNVTSKAPLLQSESTALGQVISESSVADLPLNGRNFTQLATLTPGARSGPTTGFVRGSTIQVNGMRTENTVFVVNGVNTTDQDFEGTTILPPPDAIREFKVQSNDLGAAYGLGGAMINVELKSGTNALHGDVYEFLRNDALDARNFFSTSTPQLQQNQFGFTLGGPIKKDRTFFFGDYEGTRIRSGQTFNSIVPSGAMRSGDFSGLKTIVDPTTGKPFPNNQILSFRFSPQATFFLPFFPLPNSPQGTFIRTANNRNDSNQFDIRIDHQLRSRDSLRFTYSFLQPFLFVPGAFPENGAVTTTLRHHAASFAQTHIFSPSVVNEFTWGYLRVRSFGAQQGLGANYTVQAGIGGFEQTTQAYPGFPAITPTGFQGLNDNAFQPLRFRENNYNLDDKLTLVKGKHTIQLGADLTWHANFTTNSGRSRGQFTFSGTYTGNSWADFLLGLPFQGLRTFPRDLFGYFQNNQGLFLQDGWKLSPRLTLTLGLRYSLIDPPYAMHNALSSVDPVANRIVVASDSQGQISTNAQQVESVSLPVFSDIIVPGSKIGLGRSLRYVDAGNLGPRLGAAWQPGGGYVLRAGYGILYSRRQGVQIEGTVAGANLPFAADATASFNTTPTPTLTLANFFGPATPQGLAQTPLGFFQLDPESPTPYFQQWNFAVQKAIRGVVSVEGAYVGNKGTHLTLSRPVNVPLPGAGVIQRRRPNTRFAAGSLIEQTDNSIYHAFQSKAEIRSWRGFNLLATYTWAKGLDYQAGDFQLSPVQDPNNLRAERGVTNEPAHRFTLSAVYELPFLRNRTDTVGLAFGGWEMTSILTSQSGFPFTPTISTDPANTGRSTRPNRVGSGALPNPSINGWFDVSAFRVPADFTYGNSGVNIVYGPGSTMWDFGLFKNFPLTRISEGAHLQFRTEFFNFINKPNFANPMANIQSPAAGKILSAGTPRQIQFALKLIF